MSSSTRLSGIIATHERALLDEWLRRLQEALPAGRSAVSEAELRHQATQFLAHLRAALESNEAPNGPAWRPLRQLLDDLSRTRSVAGHSPSETALFVFSFKRPLFERLRTELAKEPASLFDETVHASDLIDDLGLWTTEAFQKSREQVIQRQQQEMLELSTPVVKLWDGVLALPLIGTLDSQRTQVVMESLLERITTTGATVAIIDITGVPMVDTLVAQHLLKTVAAARLMGAECIISGVRPQIAQTVVQLGVELTGVVTKATLADAFKVALQRVATHARANAPLR